MKRHDPKLEQELLDVLKLVATRKANDQLKDIDEVIRKWKKKNIQPGAGLSEIRRIVLTPLLPKGAKEDPGLALAQAAGQGLISKKDMSAEAWKAIEVLMTVIDL